MQDFNEPTTGLLIRSPTARCFASNTLAKAEASTRSPNEVPKEFINPQTP